MREFDVTPQQQGSTCVFQSKCHFYLYGIYCNRCAQYEDFDDLDCVDNDYE